MFGVFFDDFDYILFSYWALSIDKFKTACGIARHLIIAIYLTMSTRFKYVLRIIQKSMVIKAPPAITKSIISNS